ncbi:hypothetical protein EVAR_80573_1 [Eumeta japonica]|uniref:Uncharacterized protein n=1 Tax=Eumeta variegata TaxID=151549 RepID=A0A4C1TNF6_EUMVA|nr:hypothetical protein EVAR_80573_1 [Eumeta japonica]
MSCGPTAVRRPLGYTKKPFQEKDSDGERWRRRTYVQVRQGHFGIRAYTITLSMSPRTLGVLWVKAMVVGVAPAGGAGVYRLLTSFCELKTISLFQMQR